MSISPSYQCMRESNWNRRLHCKCLDKFDEVALSIEERRRLVRCIRKMQYQSCSSSSLKMSTKVLFKKLSHFCGLAPPCAHTLHQLSQNSPPSLFAHLTSGSPTIFELDSTQGTQLENHSQKICSRMDHNYHDLQSSLMFGQFFCRPFTHIARSIRIVRLRLRLKSFVRKFR